MFMQCKFNFCFHKVRMTTVVSSISVFLLAESRLLREALTRILRKRNDIHVVGSSSCSETVTNAIGALFPQVLLFDPVDVMSGLTLVRTLRDQLPAMKVILIGMESCPEIFLRSVREGIAGYALKDATAAEIASAVRSVVSNHAVCPPELCQTLFDYVARQRADFPNFA